MIRIVIPGDPGPARINAARRARRTAVGVRTYATHEHTAWRARATLAVRAAMRGREPLDGPVRVVIETAWPRQRRTGPAAGMPLGDVDACLKVVLDVLARGGDYHDDAQVCALTARSVYSAREPGITVAIARDER